MSGAGPRAAGVELRRQLGPRLAIAIVVGLWLASRDWSTSGGELSAGWRDVDASLVSAQARAACIAIGAVAVTVLWWTGLDRTHAAANGDERALWQTLAPNPLRRVALRVLIRGAAALTLLVPTYVAAEHAAQGRPARALLASLEHPGHALLGTVDEARLELADPGDGALRLTLLTLPGSGPSAEARVRLERGEATTERVLTIHGRREFELTPPRGRGPLTLVVTGVDGSTTGAVYLPGDSLRWVGGAVHGSAASRRVLHTLVLAALVTAAWWPVLRRRLDALLAVGLLASLWIAAWAGAPFARALPAGRLPHDLTLLGSNLVPPFAVSEAAAGAAWIAAGVLVELVLVRRFGEATQR